MPRELRSFFVKRDIFSSRWSSPIGSAYKDSLASTDKKYLKYIRAYNHHLLSGDEKLSRLDEQSMQELRNSIKRQDGYTCKICSKFGKSVELHVHHIIPIDKYGSNHPNNLITLCHSCHNKQHPAFQVTRNIPITRKRTGGDFVSIDIETTGFSCADDEIIEVGAARFDGGRCIQRYESLIRPRRKEVPYEILNMTGIKSVELENAPPPEDVLPSLVDFVAESKIVGHNIRSFDLQFLARSCERTGIVFPDHDIVDTLALCREKLNTDNHKLQTVLHFFHIEARKNHRALSDALATGKLYPLVA